MTTMPMAHYILTKALCGEKVSTMEVDPALDVCPDCKAILDTIPETPEEPEYEYTHVEVGGHVATPRWTTAEAALKALAVYTYPEHWRVVRRPKPQPWEDVQ